MSFHPQMPYGTRPVAQVRAQARRRGAAVHVHAGEPGAARGDRARYPPERRQVGAAAGALPGAGPAGLRHAPARWRTSPRSSAARPAEVEDVVSYYVMFFTRPVGKYVIQVCRTLSCALLGAGRVTEELSQSAGHRRERDRRGRRVHADGDGVPRRLRPRAGGDGEQRVLARMPAARGRRSRLIDELRARGPRRPDRVPSQEGIGRAGFVPARTARAVSRTPWPH